MFWPLYPWERSLVPIEEERVGPRASCDVFEKRKISFKFKVLLFYVNMT